jgi:ribosomal protein S18 acetylase RimI-like enzyme
MSVTVARAGLGDLDALAPLFAAYRAFYGRSEDLPLAHAFLGERLQRGESVALLARLDGAAAGFVQLYPSFSSVSAARTWILNDLFVALEARRRGVAQALLGAATAFARNDGAIRLELETDLDNHEAQSLYRAAGWQLFDGTLRFRLPLDG